MTVLFVLPSIHEQSTRLCLAGMAPDVRAATVVVDNAHGQNRGVAASWNVGARLVLDGDADWLAVVSGATRFGPCGGRDFAGFLKRTDPNAVWVVESSPPVGWHLLGWSRRVLETVGLFDENYFAYGEDADMSRRVHIAQAEGDGGAWVKEPFDAWITMQGHAVKLAGIQVDYSAIAAFHRVKWGCDLGSGDGYRRPFDDPALPLSFWPVPPDPRSIMASAV